MVKDTRQGWALFWAMAVMFLMGVFVAYPAEQAGNPILAKLGVESAATATQSGGNMEAKETRFGITGSALFATVTTDASCGAVNSMHDSYTPLGGLVPLFNMQTDEVIFGGVGAGLYGMLLYAIVGVFIAGLMVGRTPEYIGKKIQQKEVKMALFAILATSFLILVAAGISIVIPFAKGGYWNPPGPGDRKPEQRRPSWAERDAVRVHEPVGEQRQRVRRHHRQHAVVRPDARPGDAVRTVPVHYPGARGGGQPCQQEGRADICRHACPRMARSLSVSSWRR